MFVKELEITLENGMKISGELDLPERQGQWKTIILFHGSGPSDRHATVESMGGIVSRNFDLLSEGFVKARYAVFRYDKRENYDIEIIIRDAREVTRFVSGLSEVEGILFYGWSEGVRVCTTLVSDFPNAQALILQSGIAEGWSSYFSYILRELTVEKLKELTDVQAAYLVGKTEAVKWGGIGCKGYIEVDFGSYSAEELSRAWKVLVNRHEMLRAKVTEVGFEILERDEIDYEIKIVNLQKMAEREKVDTLSKIREDFGEYVFHTEEPPLFKVLITKRIEGNFFHLLVDLIVSDFASVQLLISEMGELLKGASLEKIRYKFSDYAMFNQQRKGSLKWHQDRMYWLERLKKLPEAPILPQDGRAADKCENTYEFYRFQKHINQSDWKRIKEIAGEYGVTVSSVLIGIYAEVISRWSSNKHFTLNLPIQNRPTIGNNTNSIVGDFTAVNLLEVNVTQNMSFIANFP